MKLKSHVSLVVTVLLALAGTAQAQVPSTISYQGRVQVSGTNFSGAGQFKFALVSPGTNINRRATAMANLTGAFLTSITVTDGGSGYLTPPAVTITDPTGSGASATAQISGGVVTNVVVNSTGNSYSSPTVSIAPPPPSVANDILWTNDGTSGGAGGEPSSAVTVSVQQGLFNVFLGDAMLANMQPVPASVFTQSDVRLRIWFNNGVQGFARLMPDQNLGSVGFAMTAAQLASTTDGQPLVFKASSMEAMRIDSVGNVGIGVTNPLQLLHLNVTAGHGEGMVIESAIAGHSPAIYLNHTGTGGRNFRIASFGDNVNPGSFRIRDDTEGADRFVIDASGRVDVSGGVDVNGGIRVYDGFFKSRNAGIATEVSAQLVNFGINDGPFNRFGGTYTAASQGGFLRLDARAGVPLFCFHGRPAGTNVDTSQLGYITSSGTVRFEIGINQKFSLGGSGTFEIDSPSATAGRFVVAANGNVGIGRAPAANLLEVEGNASKTTAGDWLANSDARIKTDVHTVTHALQKLARVRPVEFRYTEEYRAQHPGIEDRPYLNVIAQEFQKVFPEAVKTSGDKLPNGEPILQVDSYPLTIYSAAAIQELNQKVEEQRAENADLKQRLEKLERLLNQKFSGDAR